jgi:hypothetical protein
MLTRRSLYLVLVFCLSGCGMRNGEVQREPISASVVQEREAQCEEMASAHAEFWTSHDMDTFDQVYTEDIVHDDGDTYIEGAEEVSSMADTVFMFFPRLQTRLRSLYIAGEDCLGVYEYFPLELGGYAFTPEDPLIEIDMFRLRGDWISYWALFENHETIEKQYSDTEVLQRLEQDRMLLERFAQAWSSNKVGDVVDLYAEGATREDLTFAEMNSGRQEIRSAARTYFKLFPEVDWELQMPFLGYHSGLNVAGGIFAIQIGEQSSQACTIEAAVLLSQSDEEIVKESIYYDTDSLLECGWAE